MPNYSSHNKSYTPRLENLIPLALLIPTYENSMGVNKKIYPTIEESLELKDEKANPINLFYGSCKSYGGTEKNVNGVYSIEDTTNIECFYRPDIKSDCAIGVISTGAIYEILGDPEDIDMRHQYLHFKAKRIKGKA